MSLLELDAIAEQLRLRTLAAGLDHPEAVCWSPAEECLYAGGEAGQLYRFGLDGGPADVVAQAPGGFLVGLAVDGEGNVYACDVGNGCVQRIGRDGEIGRHGPEIGYPNYPVFSADGSLFVSDSGSWSGADGGIVRIAPDGSGEPVPMAPLRFANGLALRDGDLYVVESAAATVLSVPFAGGATTTVVRLDRTVPDGLAFDAEGGLWISCFQPNRIYRLDPDGTLETVVDDWSGSHLMTPTNIAFAGPRLDVLAVASLGGTAVSALDPGIAGRPLDYPTLSA